LRSIRTRQIAAVHHPQPHAIFQERLTPPLPCSKHSSEISFTSEEQTLVNTVNCVGVMGKGIALEFKKRFPAVFEDYAVRGERKEVKLGEPYPFFGPDWPNGAKLPHERALALPIEDRGYRKRIGPFRPPLQGVGHDEHRLSSPGVWKRRAGLGGSRTSHRRQTAPASGSSAEVYAPYGTPRPQLTEAFLGAPSQMTLEGKGRKHEKLNPLSRIFHES